MNNPKLSTFFRGVRSFTTKHSPEILTSLGLAGMATTVVLAVRATPKALQLIEEEKVAKETDKLTVIETVKAAWKPYVPAAATGLASAACIIGASSVSIRRNAALATAYKLSEAAAKEYREKVVETIGEKKEQTVRDKVNQEQLDKHPVTNNEVIITGKGNTLFFDYTSKRYFKSDIEKLRKIENQLNKQMLHDICGNISLNEFYDEIGLERVQYGDDLGWNTDELIDIAIGPGVTEDEEPCLVLSHHNAPRYNYA